MIECSICHVMNEDSARFCAECGQRLVTPETSGQETENATPEPHKATAAPTTAAATAPITLQAFPPAPITPAPVPPNVVPPAAIAEPVKPVPPPPALKLRSPLLAGDEEPEMPPERANRASPGRQPDDLHKGLRSPLLGGNEFDDQYSDSYDTHDTQKPKSGGLRSPLLGASDFNDYDDEPPSGSHLHSPLLQGNEPPYRAPASATSRPGHLRSPLLGQDFDQEDDFIEDIVNEDDVNVLRSPLLQSRVPISDKPKAPAESQASGEPATTNESELKISADKKAILQKLEQSKYGSPPKPNESGASQSAIDLRAASTQQPDAASAQANIGATSAQSPFRPSDPFPLPDKPANSWPAVGQSPSAAYQSPVSKPWATNRSQGDEEKQATSVAGDATTAGAASWVDIKVPNLAASTSDLAIKPADKSLSADLQASPSPPAQEPRVAAKDAGSPQPLRPRLQSKLLAHDEDDFDAPAQPGVAPSLRRMSESKSFSAPGPEHAGIIQFFVVCLCIGIAMKLWVIFEFFRGGALTPPVLGDELGQLVAMFFLVFLGSIYTKPPAN